MGAGYHCSPYGRCLALRMFHPKHRSTRYRHDDLLMRRLPREVEQDLADNRRDPDADSSLPRRLGFLYLVGMVDAQTRT